MNKHVLTFSQIINESIGVGSVLLIKGKPSSDGRYLYATTIKGSIEIKPGIKMVFIGDEIYRVINKEGRFFGRKISYGSEEGLKGIFNMKNPGRPSIVLNHNKTPFHWITLKFNDIGSALREIGPRLFSHELILESDIDAQDNNQERQKELYDTICLEILKAISGQENLIELRPVEAAVNDPYNTYNKWSPKVVHLEDIEWVEEILIGGAYGDTEEVSVDATHEWSAKLEAYLDPDKFREYGREMAELGLGGEFMDMLDIQETIPVSILFSSKVIGSYWEGGGEIDEVDTQIISITIGEKIIPVTQTPAIQKISNSLGYVYSDHDYRPPDIRDDMEIMFLKSIGDQRWRAGKKGEIHDKRRKNSLSRMESGTPRPKSWWEEKTAREIIDIAKSKDDSINESDIDADGIEDSQDNEISVPIDDMDQRIQSEENYNSQERQKELHDTICLEILKAISGQESRVSPTSIVLEDDSWEEDLGEIEDGYDTFEWYANMEIYLDPNKFREYERELADLELGGDFMDMLDVQNNIEVSILFESDVSVRHIHERGDYYEPDYYETELESADTGIMSIVIDDIYGNEIIATQTPEIKKLALDLEYLYSDHDMVPSDIKEDMEFMIMKSNGTHLNLDGKKKQRFNLKEATKKRSLALRDAGRALNPVGKRVKDPRLDQLAEEIREYWKKETGASEISNRDLLRIERDKINLEYYRSMSTDYSQTMFKSRIETIQKRLKEEIDRISK